MRMVIRVPGPVPNWNEYINEERRNKYGAAKYKKDEMKRASDAAHGKKWKGAYPIQITVNAHLKNKQRDLDNVRYKGFIDGFRHVGTLEEDNLKHIVKYIVNGITDDHEETEFIFEEADEDGREKTGRDRHA